ncbi:GDSL-type esterase/lipase family protein [Microbacterium sp. KSW4-11]|uniref:GDSL-type esterase/lipase family protein n=1 Tax=Microbacterium gawkjiense TaxID=3067309 RepID=A0ABU3GEC0_9MICO|nr:GDSL-type esterase/lipase family protein [Microbacterium sp. KSW4-11]MDT3317806.1 GDSL-type esterase/lipase family protein [Microbacterium sp. KSW4-11]
MTSERRARGWGLGIIAVGVAAIVALAAWQPWRSISAVDAASSSGGVSAVEPLSLPADPDVLVFGDSWTYGAAATVPTDGYAYRLGRLTGWDVTVDGVRGSGYMKPGWDGPDFRTRAKWLDPAADYDLIIIQGSINDRQQGERGYREAVDATWDVFARLYPHAQIVIFGPTPHQFPIDEGTARIDRDLQKAAADRHWWYISPLQEQWVTPANYLDVIDVGAGKRHPSDRGHAYLAERLQQALVDRSASTDAVAPTEDESAPVRP